ncbi:MAG: substrate-binding domain-containing protein [bacterium]|nr:substrate-binding domain-containing protein [bacterium]
MKRIAITLIAATLLFAGCNRGPDAAKSNAPRVGFVMKTLNNPFFIAMEEGANQAAKDSGAEVMIQAPEREIDVERQMQIIENLIQAGVDALCITPSGSKEIVPAVKKANEAGVPVLIVDTRLDQAAADELGAKADTFIGSDNVEGGRLAGEYFAKRYTEETPICVLEGVPGHETHDSRLRGFMEAVKAAPQLKVVASQPANAEREQGFNVFQNILQTHPEVKALFCTNDMMALGAIQAIAQANRTGTISVIGFDAVDEARDAIRRGDMTGSIAQSPHEMGRLAVVNALKRIAGESIPAEIPVKIELITKDNVDQ